METKMQEKNISANELEQCVKCTVCTAYCPVLKVSVIYPGPKQSGPDGERYRLKSSLFMDNNIKYCLNCKRCEVVCPSGVKIADIIHSARETYGRQIPKVRDFILASTDLMGSVASPFAPVVNAVTGLGATKFVLDKVMAIDHRRTFPKYSGTKFETWFRKEAAPVQGTFKKRVSYFHGCYVNYNYPQLGKDFVTLMNALGVGVDLLEKERCCGVAKISSGMFETARKHARINIASMEKAMSDGRKVLTTSTTCTLTMKDEYPDILGLDNTSVKDGIVLAIRYIYEMLEKGEAKIAFKEGYRARAAYHVPCHMEKMGLSIFTRKLLKMIPGMELVSLDSNCCGIAGTYGFKKENYARSQAIGKALFDNINAVNPDFVACECETCKWQIEMSTAYKVKNPVSILAEAVDIEKTKKLNNA